MMDENDQRAKMEEFVAILHDALRDDPTVLAKYFAEDVVFTHWRWRGGELLGREEVIKKYFAPLRDSFDDIDYVVRDAIYGDDKLATRAQFSATFARDWGDIPAHGRRVSYAAHDLYDFQDGKVVRAWYANDTLSAARQFGVVSDDGKVVGVDSAAR